MADHGEWHGESICKLTRKLLDMDHEVYSECMRPNLKFIELEPTQILGKTPGKLGISLFVGSKSLETRLSKPDMVLVENNEVKHIIEVEESKNPIEIAGLIVATRVADLCDVNSEKVRVRPMPVKDAVLHILFQSKMTENVHAVVDSVIEDKGNLAKINVLGFDEFVNNIDEFL